MVILPKKNDVQCQLNLGGSKSESNRALMISAYGGFVGRIQNLSDADDTKLLQKLLVFIENANRKEINTVDCSNAGTVYRFLLSYLAGQEGSWLLTGNERMSSRPIGPLVDALKNLGAHIEYKGKVGFPPLLVIGGKMRGGTVSVNTSQSSQFASSLLLAAPSWAEGLQLTLTGDLKSLPYIDMTIATMSHFRAVVKRQNNQVTVEPVGYKKNAIVITPDWTSASYWYEMASFSSTCNIIIRKLVYPSWQGDAVITSICEQFGVYSVSSMDSIVMQKAQAKVRNIRYDFSNTPDLFPTVSAICAGLGLEAIFTGLENLAIKESDRVAAMDMELSKIGVRFIRLSDDVLHVLPADTLPVFSKNDPVFFDSHGDHRIAMSLSLLAMKIGAVKMLHPEVVAKSYPLFWNDLRRCGAFVML